MTQIKENQIISSPTPERNPVVSPPRDLAFTVKDGIVDEQPSTSPSQSAVTGTETQQTVYENNIAAIKVPATPAILSVKSQAVNMQDDGTSMINVILVVEDIPGVTEYDIRIAPTGAAL